MHMDAARFSPGRWVGWVDQIGAAARGALLWQRGAESGIGVGLGQRWRGFVPALCCNPGPLRASMRICRPLALNLQARAARSGIEALSPGWQELQPHRLRGSEPAALPPTSAVGDMSHGLSAWACDAG